MSVIDMSSVNRRHNTDASHRSRESAVTLDALPVTSDGSVPSSTRSTTNVMDWLRFYAHEGTQKARTAWRHVSNSQYVLDWLNGMHEKDDESGLPAEWSWNRRARTWFHAHWHQAFLFLLLLVFVMPTIWGLWSWLGPKPDLTRMESLPAMAIDISMQYTKSEREMLPFLACKTLEGAEFDAGRLESRHTLHELETAMRAARINGSVPLGLAAVHVKLNRCLLLVRANTSDLGHFLYNPRPDLRADTGRLAKIKDRSVFCWDDARVSDRGNHLVVEHVDPLLKTSLFSTYTGKTAYDMGSLLDQMRGQSPCKHAY